MSRSRGVGRFRGRLWRWTLGVLAAGLLVAVIVYAANPDGDVTISPRNDQWETSGVTDVWGLSETIRYRAACSPCEGPHNCHFTSDGGLTTHVENNPDVLDSIYGSKASTGSYNLAARCPEDGSHGAPTASFKVVSLAHLKISGDNVEGTAQFFPKADTGDVTVTAELTPTTTASELRSDFINWTKTAGTLSFSKIDELTVTVSKTTPGYITLQAKGGSEGTSKIVTIWVVGIKNIQIYVEGWQNVDGGDDEVFLKGMKETFKAIRDPETAPQWPTGEPTWDSSYWGTSRTDNGDQTTVTMTGEYDDRYLKATCGTSEKAVDFHIIVPTISRVDMSGTGTNGHDMANSQEYWPSGGGGGVYCVGCFTQGAKTQVKVQFSHAKTLSFETPVEIRADVSYLDEDITGGNYDRTVVDFGTTWSDTHSVESENNAKGEVNYDTNVDMQWQYRVPIGTNSWTCVGNSDDLKYYLVWATPTAPQATPWYSVIEKATDWAEDETSAAAVATEITQAINSSDKFQYDGPPTVPLPLGDGSSKYINYGTDRFNLTQVLADLGGETTVDVNCSDCGHMVTTFANAVGCQLWSSQMGDDFQCNQVMVIGASTWAEPFGGNGFSYHEVAWSGACGNSDKVNDACLKVDGNGAPSSEPRTAELPTDVTFSDGSQGTPYVYREKLAKPGASGYDKCLCKPATKVRRTCE